jgi:hypothetical protein
MSNLILISASATVVLIVVTIIVANPDDGIGWESSVLDSTILQVLLIIVCYYRQRGGASMPRVSLQVVEAGAMSHPKISNFGMSLKFTKF